MQSPVAHGRVEKQQRNKMFSMTFVLAIFCTLTEGRDVYSELFCCCVWFQRLIVDCARLKDVLFLHYS